MKILMTGSTGYVGAHLLPKLLDKGHEVFTLVRPGRNTMNLLTVGAEVFRNSNQSKSITT